MLTSWTCSTSDREAAETLGEIEAARVDAGDKVLEQARSHGYEGESVAEASEWEQAVAKNLDMSQEARMQRAREMGFGAPQSQHPLGTPGRSTEPTPGPSNESGTQGVYVNPKTGQVEGVLYHGTMEDIHVFGNSGQNSNTPSGMIALSSSPVIAGSYTIPLGVPTRRGKEIERQLNDLYFDYDNPNRDRDIETLKEELQREKADFAKDRSVPENIMPVVVRTRNPLVIDAEGRKWTNVNGGGTKGADGKYYEGLPVDGRLSQAQEDAKDINIMAKEAQAAGYDSLVVRNVIDPGDHTVSDVADTVFIFDPSNIRSVNAAFDPDKSTSANILDQMIPVSARDGQDIKDRIDQAEDMEAFGAHQDDIWQETGLFKSWSGEWARWMGGEPVFKPDAQKLLDDNGGVEARLEELIEWPELFSEFPELRDLDVDLQYSNDVAGALTEYEDGTFRIDVAAKEIEPDKGIRLMQILRHELQHAIQVLTGMTSVGADSEVISTMRGSDAYKYVFDFLVHQAKEENGQAPQTQSEIDAIDRKAIIMLYSLNDGELDARVTQFASASPEDLDQMSPVSIAGTTPSEIELLPLQELQWSTYEDLENLIVAPFDPRKPDDGPDYTRVTPKPDARKDASPKSNPDSGQAAKSLADWMRSQGRTSRASILPAQGQDAGQGLNQSGEKVRGQARIPAGGAMDSAQVQPEQGVFSEEAVMVRLTQAANKTTFMHESAHIFLEIYAALEGENAIIAEEMKAIRKWLKVKDGQPFTREHHEMFAESFETYLMEGRAPSSELRDAFRSFRAWFVEVWRSLRGKKAALPNLEPEAREIFDKMLATKDEVEAARRNYVSTVSKHVTGIMTPAEVDKYQEQARKAGETAQDKLMRKFVDEIRKREKREWRAQRKEIESRVTREVETMPAYRAKAGFDRATMDADVMAPQFGFTTGREMLEAIKGLPGKKRFIREETDRQMKELHGDLIHDGTVEREAIEAVFNEPSIRMMEAERNALAKQAGKKPIPLTNIRAQADAMIARTPIKDIITPGRFAIRARDLHKKSITQAARGEWEAALRSTHQAMLYHELARRAYKSRDEIEKIKKFMSRFAPNKALDPKKIDPEYIKHIHMLMRLPGSDNQQEVMRQLVAFAEAQTNLGYPVHVPALIEAGETVPDLRSMSMDLLRDLRDGIKSLNALGRELSEENRQRFNQKVGGLTDQIDKNWGTRERKYFEQGVSGIGEQVGSWVRGFDALILRWPYLIESLQGGLSGDLVTEMDTKLRGALTKRNGHRRDMGRELADILTNAGITNKRLKTRLRVPEINNGRDVSFEHVLAVALNMGSEQNRDRLEADVTINADADQLMDMLNRELTEADWRAVQKIWDLIGTLWPDASRLQERMTGVSPKKVEASSVTTKYGTLKGGYYPLKYDPDAPANADIAKKTEADLWKEHLSGLATHASTKKGFLKERQNNVQRPLHLSLDVVLSHIDDVTNDIHMRETSSEIWRIINHRDFKSELAQTHGKEYQKSLETILSRTVSGTERPANLAEQIMRTFRINASVAILGHNVTSAILAPISYVQTVVPRYGPKVVLEGMARYYSGQSNASFIKDKSTFMAERLDTINREAHELVRRAGPIQTGFSKFQATGFWLMSNVELATVSGPLWTGVYYDALAQGKPEDIAITEADRAVATTQGSGLEMDQSVMQGGGEGMRMLTFMYGYVSGYYGIVRNDIAKQEGMSKALPIIKHLLILNATAALLEAFIRNGFGDEEDPYFQSVLELMNRNAFGLIPGLSTALSRYSSEPSMMGTIQGFGDTARIFSGMREELIDQGHIEGDTIRKAAGTAVETAGLSLGVPGTIQLKKSLKTLEEDDDPMPWEVLITGPDNDN